MNQIAKQIEIDKYILYKEILYRIIIDTIVNQIVRMESIQVHYR